jgi:4-hydroxy-tetrahydrodipicolinate reductase
MKLAIIGYGRMGYEIEAIARSRSHEVITFDTQCKADFCEITEENMKGVDVAIDFTIPETAISNTKILNNLKINTVMGTTGWYNKTADMKKAAKDIGFIWSGNFSIGVNLFFNILEKASKIMNKVQEYDVLAYEAHHNKKKDSPSGTANMMADILIKNLDKKDKLVTERLDRPIKENELHFASIRGGSIPGTHSIQFDSAADNIELKHTARNRSGFALGAVLAAEWVKGKKGFFNINDFMKELLEVK